MNIAAADFQHGLKRETQLYATIFNVARFTKVTISPSIGASSHINSAELEFEIQRALSTEVSDRLEIFLDLVQDNKYLFSPGIPPATSPPKRADGLNCAWSKQYESFGARSNRHAVSIIVASTFLAKVCSRMTQSLRSMEKSMQGILTKRVGS